MSEPSSRGNAGALTWADMFGVKLLRLLEQGIEVVAALARSMRAWRCWNRMGRHVSRCWRSHG